MIIPSDNHKKDVPHGNYPVVVNWDTFEITALTPDGPVAVGTWGTQAMRDVVILYRLESEFDEGDEGDEDDLG